jgi:hypothetical protein
MRYRSATGSTSRSMPRLRIEYGVSDYQNPGVAHAAKPIPGCSRPSSFGLAVTVSIFDYAESDRRSSSRMYLTSARCAAASCLGRAEDDVAVVLLKLPSDDRGAGVEVDA